MSIQKYKLGIPVLLGELTKDGTQCRAWCPWCRRWHYHGVYEDGSGFAGHRAAGLEG